MFAKFSSKSQLHHLQSLSNPPKCENEWWEVGPSLRSVAEPTKGVANCPRHTFNHRKKVKDFIFDKMLSKALLKLSCWSQGCFKPRWYKE